MSLTSTALERALPLIAFADRKPLPTRVRRSLGRPCRGGESPVTDGTLAAAHLQRRAVQRAIADPLKLPGNGMRPLHEPHWEARKLSAHSESVRCGNTA